MKNRTEALNQVAATAAAANGGAVPCLNSNNCIDDAIVNKNKEKIQPVFLDRFVSDAKGGSQSQLNQYSTSHRKSAMALEMNVHRFIEKFGLNNVGFLTLTFADDVQDVHEASRRFHSLRTNFLKKHFDHYVCVYERMKSGRIHFHLIVNTRTDIRRGLNFKALSQKDYSSANANLRQLWALLRENVHKYGFGRTELLPVKTNSKGLAAYVAKYIAKHIDSRLPEDKGYRLIRTTIDKKSLWKIATSNFAFASKGAKEWRRKLKAWIASIEDYLIRYAAEVNGWQLPAIDEKNYSDVLSIMLSPKWAYDHANQIMGEMPQPQPLGEPQ